VGDSLLRHLVLRLPSPSADVYLTMCCMHVSWLCPMGWTARLLPQLLPGISAYFCRPARPFWRAGQDCRCLLPLHEQHVLPAFPSLRACVALVLLRTRTAYPALRWTH